MEGLRDEDEGLLLAGAGPAREPGWVVLEGLPEASVALAAAEPVPPPGPGSNSRLELGMFRDVLSGRVRVDLLNPRSTSSGRMPEDGGLL